MLHRGSSRSKFVVAMLARAFKIIIVANIIIIVIAMGVFLE
jgi:hypothetical protein